MSSLRVAELDAAQALLELQSCARESTQNTNDRDTEETAKLMLNCFVPGKHEAPSNEIAATIVPETEKPYICSVTLVTDVNAPVVGPSTSMQTLPGKSPKYEQAQHPCSCTSDINQKIYTSKRSKIFKKTPTKYYPVKYSTEPGNDRGDSDSNEDDEDTKTIVYYAEDCIYIIKRHGTPEMRDMATQTPDFFDVPIVGSSLVQLDDKINKLLSQVEPNDQVAPNSPNVGHILNGIYDTTNKPSTSTNGAIDDTNDEMYETLSDSDGTRETRVKNKAGPNRKGVKSSKAKPHTTSNVKRRALSSLNANTDGNDMIPIGNGNAMIPARIFRHINWNSYTTATRKLLTAVFSRKVLATHCLTGKRSPAFQSKPAKKMLDAAIVYDIVQTVSQRCGVPESVVRTSITTKCADESKMFRTRQKNKKKRQTKVDTENIPPSSESN